MARDLKLGVFVIVTVAAAIVAAVVLGVHALGEKTVPYHTYFDESVQGLDVGAPVKYRGVQVGSVDTIDLAADRRHVVVVLAIAQHDSRRLALATLAPKLRAQIGTQGITGVKYIDMDFANAAEPPPELPFAPVQPYIPSKPSLMTGLTTEYRSLRRRLPELADRGTVTLDKVDRLLDDVHESHVFARAGSAFDRIAVVAADTHRLVAHVDSAHLPERVAKTLDHTDDVGRTARASLDELDRAMRELGEAARSIHELADDIDRDPDILLKGRERSSQR